ncbi:MAG: hypothetical protein WA863_05885, partial [Methyloceanibacter sp.]
QRPYTIHPSLRGFVVSAAAAGASAPWASTTLTSFIAILLLSLCFDLSPIDPLLPGSCGQEVLDELLAEPRS